MLTLPTLSIWIIFMGWVMGLLLWLKKRPQLQPAAALAYVKSNYKLK